MTEWRAPEKDQQSGQWTTRSLVGKSEVYLDVFGHLTANATVFDDTAVPADAALRLLAADASNRLGWTWWRDDDNDDEGRMIAVDADGLRAIAVVMYGVRLTFDFEPERGLTSDELIAALHGKFLLDAAMKEKV